MDRLRSTGSSAPQHSAAISSDPAYSTEVKLARSSRQRERASGNGGFTLVEVLVVVAIISLVIGLVGPRVIGSLRSAKEKAAQIQIEALKSAVDLFFIDNGRYPTMGEGLSALVIRPDGLASWRGPYLRSAAVPKDPSGKEFRYQLAEGGTAYQLELSGP